MYMAKGHEPWGIRLGMETRKVLQEMMEGSGGAEEREEVSNEVRHFEFEMGTLENSRF